jgi:hypothetical protein
MTDRETLVALLGEEPELARQLRIGCGALELLYTELMRANVPPSPLFEVQRIIEALPVKREIVFVMGLLSEGENEAALLFALANDVLAAAAEADVAHLIDEAWYYLRTSIDPGWQIDDGAPSAPAALAYLAETLQSRLAQLASLPPRALPNGEDGARAERLRALRSGFSPLPVGRRTTR